MDSRTHTHHHLGVYLGKKVAACPWSSAGPTPTATWVLTWGRRVAACPWTAELHIRKSHFSLKDVHFEGQKVQ